MLVHFVCMSYTAWCILPQLFSYLKIGNSVELVQLFCCIQNVWAGVHCDACKSLLSDLFLVLSSVWRCCFSETLLFLVYQVLGLSISLSTPIILRALLLLSLIFDLMHQLTCSLFFFGSESGCCMRHVALPIQSLLYLTFLLLLSMTSSCSLNILLFGV